MNETFDVLRKQSGLECKESCLCKAKGAWLSKAKGAWPVGPGTDFKEGKVPEDAGRSEYFRVSVSLAGLYLPTTGRAHVALRLKHYSDVSECSVGLQMAFVGGAKMEWICQRCHRESISQPFFRPGLLVICLVRVLFISYFT